MAAPPRTTVVYPPRGIEPGPRAVKKVALSTPSMMLRVLRFMHHFYAHAIMQCTNYYANLFLRAQMRLLSYILLAYGLYVSNYATFFYEHELFA